MIANEDGLALGFVESVDGAGACRKGFGCAERTSSREVAQEIVKGNIAMSAWTDLIQMVGPPADAAFALTNGEIPPSNDVITIEGKEVPGMRIESRGVTNEGASGIPEAD